MKTSKHIANYFALTSKLFTRLFNSTDRSVGQGTYSMIQSTERFTAMRIADANPHGNEYTNRTWRTIMAKTNDKTAAAPATVEAKKPIDDAKQKKNDARKAARKVARERIVKFIVDNTTELGGLVDDLKLFIGGGRAGGARAPRTSINSELRTALIEAGDVGLGEMDVFKRFHIGRPEMITKGRIFVLCPNPADRVWVKFDEATETYKVVGKGINPPKEWDGYVPAAKEAL